VALATPDALNDDEKKEHSELILFSSCIDVNLNIFVDRILKGTKAFELPVELPARIEMVLNLKTARAIGIDVPSALRQRADRIVQ
jgi:hypothetical protein